MHTLCGHVFAKNEIIKCEMKRYRKYKQKCVNNMSGEGEGRQIGRMDNLMRLYAGQNI